jgi:hypothetical protein
MIASLKISASGHPLCGLPAYPASSSQYLVAAKMFSHIFGMLLFVFHLQPVKELPET